MATLAAAATSLSMTGTVATVAASAAGLFSFKLSKELSARGLNKNALSRAAFYRQSRALSLPLTLSHRVSCPFLFCTPDPQTPAAPIW